MITLHCITLKMDAPRLEHVLEQQALWGGNFRVVDAIDGRTQAVSEHDGGATCWPVDVVQDRAARFGMTEPMNEPGKACTKGHVLLAQQQLDAIREGHADEGDFYLVLEDDFAFRDPNALKSFLAKVEAAGETGFDVIFLGYRGGVARHVKAPVHRAWNQLKAAWAKEPDAAAMARNEATAVGAASGGLAFGHARLPDERTGGAGFGGSREQFGLARRPHVPAGASLRPRPVCHRAREIHCDES